MEHSTAAWVAQATGGRILCGEETAAVTDISTDSRKVKAGDLYVPVLGAQADGHRFIGAAFEQGAAASLTSEHDTREEALAAGAAGRVLIRVDDTKEALQRLGAACRRRLSIPFVGVTGSVGKTSTRAMIATALSAGLRTFQTAGNANSQVGVPVTLSRVREADEAAVIELGVSDPGEMTRIASIAGLNVAVITNIGVSHIEQLGSREGILREKLHITDGLAADGVLLLNGDDELLCPKNAGEELRARADMYRTLRYGIEEWNDYRARDVRVRDGHTLFTLYAPGGAAEVTLPVIGAHHVTNALAALACADLLGVPVTAAAKALADFTGVAHRQEWIRLPGMGITVIDDSYNASPDSMRAAFSTLQLAQTQGRKLALLADMWELGPETERYHYEVGRALGATDAAVLAAVGGLARAIVRGAREAKPALTAECFDDRFAAARWLEAQMRPGDLALVKGSNGMRLFDIVEEWKKQEKTD